MITGEIKSKVDKVWDTFWTGGISNPLTVIEQLSYLLFIKRLDEIHTVKEKKANRFDEEIKDPVFTKEQDNFRWSKFKNLDAESMFDVVSKHVFPFIKDLHQGDETTYSKYMKDAIFMIQSPSLLEKVVEQLDNIPMNDRDTKGDLYEYLLSKLTTSGMNGQFRTPRHVIKMMVELMKPTPDDTIFDPSCGTSGFLVASYEYLREHNSEFVNKDIPDEMFNGNDFDSSMLRIGSMNMMLHGIENPNILAKDSLSESYKDEDKFSLILANPPFKGSLDYDGTSNSLLQVVKTKKTELLFLALMLRTMKTGGRCAVIIPDGVLFGSSNAHVTIREKIVEEHKLEAVISMPSGVFKPYAGVSTGILIFTKTNSGGTDKVWFYDMQADGYSLDDKRTELEANKHENNNIPDIITRFHNRFSEEEQNRKKTEQSFFVDKFEIVENKYDLSINRYKEIVYEEVEYESPKVILAEIQSIESDIQNELAELERVLASP